MLASPIYQHRHAEVERWLVGCPAPTPHSGPPPLFYLGRCQIFGRTAVSRRVTFLCQRKKQCPCSWICFKHFPPPVFFPLTGSTFNSSHSQVKKAELWPRHWSLMRSRTVTYSYSSSPAAITVGNLSTSPNNPYNAVFRLTLLFNRCSYFVFLILPSRNNCILNH